MKQNTFIIEYYVQDIGGNIIKESKIKVKNKLSSIQAQISLEDYLRRKIKGFNNLVVKTCKEDSNIGNIFGDIFGKDNPFKF